MCALVKMGSTILLDGNVLAVMAHGGWGTIPLLHMLWRIHIYKSRFVLRCLLTARTQFWETWTVSLLFKNQVQVKYSLIETREQNGPLTDDYLSTQLEYLCVSQSTKQESHPTTQPETQDSLLAAEHIREEARNQKDERKEILELQW
jgi:hypothetical protein